MNTREKAIQESRAFDAETKLSPDATMGDKLKTLRLSRKMSCTALSQASGLSVYAIRSFERNDREPDVIAIRKLSSALEVGTDYFMEDDLFQKELHKYEVLARAKELYGTRGMARARQIYESPRGLYAGGRLSEEDRDAFRELLLQIFFEAKENARKYTPKKYRKQPACNANDQLGHGSGNNL